MNKALVGFATLTASAFLLLASLAVPYAAAGDSDWELRRRTVFAASSTPGECGCELLEPPFSSTTTPDFCSATGQTCGAWSEYHCTEDRREVLDASCHLTPAKCDDGQCPVQLTQYCTASCNPSTERVSLTAYNSCTNSTKHEFIGCISPGAVCECYSDLCDYGP